MNNRFYIVEGETEKAFFDYLKEDQFIDSGKIRKYNLMQKVIPCGENFLSLRNAEYICVIDTDVITDTTPDHLTKNLKTLVRTTNSSKKVKLLMQNRNFEDELCRILECRKTSLPQQISPKIKELKACKQKLANMRPEEYRRLLQGAPLLRIPSVYCANPPEIIRKILEENKLSSLLTSPAKIFHLP